MSAHNSPASYRKVLAGSNRSFGLVLAAVLTLAGLAPLLHGHAMRLWAIGTAIGVFVLAFLAPRCFAPLNWVWFRLGLVLHAMVNPLIMAVLFYGAVTPTGRILKWMGKDLLSLRRDPDAASYWITREPHSPRAGSMSKQF